jgi:hypothetical protein
MPRKNKKTLGVRAPIFAESKMDLEREEGEAATKGGNSEAGMMGALRQVQAGRRKAEEEREDDASIG